jgi:tetratricopeptide (TPR) repeat protein
MNLQRSEQTQALVLRAKTALDAGQIDAAEAHVSDALRLCPGLPAARLLEARIHLRRQRAGAALASLDALDRYRTQDRSTPETAFLRAQALLDAGLNDLALTLLRKLAAEYADDVRPHRMLAGLLLKRGATAEAVIHLRRVVELAPSDRGSRILLAEAIGADKPQDAVDALGQDPADGDEDHLRLARWLRRAGREREAEELYVRLLRDIRDDAGLWIEAGELADALGAYVLAVQRLGRAVALGGAERARALAALARVHMHAGRFATAGRCWFTALRRGANQLEAAAGLIVCAQAADRPRLARRMVRVLNQRSGENERRHVLARQWFHAAGGREIARLRLDDPGAASPLAGLLTTAMQTLEQASRENPGRADTHYHLATCQAALGDAPAAAQEVQAALSINPRYKAAENLRLRLAA